MGNPGNDKEILFSKGKAPCLQSGSKDGSRKTTRVTKAKSSTGTNSLPQDFELSGADCSVILDSTSSGVACIEFPESISLDQSKDKIIDALWAENSYCVYANQVFIREKGLAGSEEAIGLNFSSLFPPDQLNVDLVKAWVEQDFLIRDYRVESETAKDKKTVLIASLYPVVKDGDMEKLWYVSRDQTPFDESLRALEKAEKQYRKIVERPGIVLTRCTPDNECLYISPTVQDIVGYTPEELSAEPGIFKKLIHPEDLNTFQLLGNARRTRETESIEIEYRIKHRDGTYHWLFERQTPELSQDGEVQAYDAVILDIQEKKKLELELIQAQRLETIGTLAEGIAHDFNNHLTAVLGQLQLILSEMDVENPIFNSLASAEQATLCCAEMTQHLLNLGRREDPELQPLDIEQLVKETHLLVKHLLPSTIDLELQCIRPISAVSGNPIQLQQVLINLAVNAKNAMPNGGSVKIRVSETSNAAELPQTAEAPRYILIEMSDSGSGIPESHLPHLFDPFFTTSKNGEGSGLGLSTAYSIIAAHNGFLTASNSKTSGAVFRVFLPALEMPIERIAAPTKDRSLKTGNETILIADDNAMVSEMVSAALTLQGYSVLTACNGEEAYKLFSDNRESISLVLADHTMPKKSGHDLLRLIHSEKPGVAKILTSGYGDVVRNSVPDSIGNFKFLGKPYDLSELSSTIRDLLEG